MIPYLEQPSLKIGPITIHAFGALVAIAIAVGYLLALRRSREKGLDPAVMERLLSWVLVCGFLGAHLVAVLAYFPGEVRAHPWRILRFWEDLSSFGGFLGGAIGVALFFRFIERDSDRTSRRTYLDVLAFVSPAAWVVGRLACTLAHDHPGYLTSFPLAFSLKTEAARRFISGVYRGAGRMADLPDTRILAQMGFHDLGWYEFLYALFFLVPLFLMLDRRPRQPGFFLDWLLAVYLPVRFGLDFLRAGDVRYFGLTPGQYGAAAIGILLIAYRARVFARAGPGEAPLPASEAGKP